MVLLSARRNVTVEFDDPAIKKLILSTSKVRTVVMIKRI